MMKEKLVHFLKGAGGGGGGGLCVINHRHYLTLKKQQVILDSLAVQITCDLHGVTTDI